MDFGFKLAKAVERGDGIAVSQLVSITNPKLADLSDVSEAQVANDVRRGGLRKDELQLWQDIAVAHWQVAIQVSVVSDLQTAFSSQNALLVAVNRAADKTDNWILPVMFLVAKELRQLSMLADVQKKQGGDTKIQTLSANLEEATRSINRSFTSCLNDRNPIMEQSRKWGVYFFVGELFKIYFKLNKRSLAKSVLKVLQNMQQQLPPLDSFPKSHVVTFLYYTGVLHFIDEAYDKAVERLTRALEVCHKKSKKNKEFILMYLIPARLLTSRHTPSDRIWNTFNSMKHLYKDIVDAVLLGDLKKFDAEVALRRRLFVKKYLYLGMEKVRTLVEIQLYRKVYVLLDKPTRIQTSQLSEALRFSTGHGSAEDTLEDNVDDFSLDQVECTLAEMIYEGQMKGYISRDRHTLVLSNKDPFPKVFEH